MPTGAKKISQLPALTRNDSEIIPVVQDDGLGNLTTGTLPITDFGTDTNIYNTDGTLTGNRTLDHNGYSLTFNSTGFLDALVLNADFGSGLNSTSVNSFGVIAESTNSVGVRGISTNNYGGSFLGANGVLGQGTTYGVAGISVGTGVYGYSTGTGYGVVPYENSGSSGALNCQGKALFDGTAATGSSLVEINSTTQGVLLPRMTTAQRDAIGTPATGLEIYNTTTNRKEVYNGTFWQGVDTRFITISFSVSSPGDNLTLGFGNGGGGLQNVSVYSTYADMRMSGSGVIRGAYLTTFCTGVIGSNENWSLYVRHNGTDYLVQTVGANTIIRTWNNTSLNIPFVDGDIVKMVFVNPTWASNPTNVVGGGFLTIQ